MKVMQSKSGELSCRERLLNSLRGLPTDRLAWSPNLAYYWDFLPPEIHREGMASYMKRMGADPLMRGFHQLFRTERKNCETKETVNGDIRRITYETPVGSLVEEYTYSKTAHSWFLTGHPVKDEEAFKILQYLFENTKIIPECGAFEADKLSIGDDGLYIPVIGTDMKTAFQALLEHWCGTVDLTYALCDFPEVVEECLAVMRRRNQDTLEASLQSSAEAFIFWEDSSTTNISPSMFEDYTAPEITAWGNRIHEEGRLLIHHACGHIRDLVSLMAELPIDLIESISPPPTGNIELWDARKILPEHIGLIGGIEPTVLADSSLEDLDGYVRVLIERMQGSRYILANSDSCPPGIAYEKFQRITQISREAAWK